MSSNIPSKPAYGVYISQLIRIGIGYVKIFLLLQRDIIS